MSVEVDGQKFPETPGKTQYLLKFTGGGSMDGNIIPQPVYLRTFFDFHTREVYKALGDTFEHLTHLSPHTALVKLTYAGLRSDNDLRSFRAAVEAGDHALAAEIL